MLPHSANVNRPDQVQRKLGKECHIVDDGADRGAAADEGPGEPRREPLRRRCQSNSDAFGGNIDRPISSFD